ncbi:MAG TPA: hypothetical protein VIL07_12185 [Symbiobacteriaceae bacterium]
MWLRPVSLAVPLLLLMPRTALASHLSGGENDLMAVYGGAALVTGFVGLLGMLGLLPPRWRKGGVRWGKRLLVIGAALLIGGGFHVSSLGAAEEAVGGAPWGQVATWQFLGTMVVFGFFAGAAYVLGKRSGVLDMGERVKYRILHNGDPVDATAWRTALPGEQRLMLIPVVAMGLLAVFVTAGVLIVLLQPAVSRP